MLTADEARSATFRQSQLAWRGYSEDDVNDFAQRAADTLEAVERDYAALRAEVDRLRSFYREHGADVDRAPAQPRPPRHNGWLVHEVERYTETYLNLAVACADSAVDGDPQSSGQQLYHARVRARLFVEDMVSAFLADPRNRARAADELQLLSGWLRGFGEAFLAQIDAMMLVAEGQLRAVTRR
ncbi:DivIVA domain-containing protein [Planosporangium sp. 12N6]|uniref:DivIVA domain-containing protein n=1 Tax=Planosporangium spinosum TaxID=3402278 RepID=UPI003CF7753E